MHLHSQKTFLQINEHDDARAITGSVRELPTILDRRAAHALVERVYDDYQRDVMPELGRHIDTPRDITVLPGEHLRRVHGPRYTVPLDEDNDAGRECQWCDFGCHRCSPTTLAT